MTEQHTPGPWRVHYERGTTQIRTAENEPIMCDETYYPWVPENQSDWHLIAAAPDLLEALEIMVASEVDYMELNNLGNPEEIDRISQARAAIRKAKGETE